MALVTYFSAIPFGWAQNPNVGAAGDSLNRPVFGFFRPTYDTNYSVVRQLTLWSQKFKFANQFGKLSLDNQTDFRIKKDSSRPDSKDQDGSTASQFAYSLFDLIPLKTSIRFQRGSSNNLNNRTLREQFNVDMDGSYNLKLFKGARTSVTGGLGTQRRKDSNVIAGNETGVKEGALNRNLSLNTTYNGPVAGMVFKLNDTFNGASTKPERLNEQSASRIDRRSNSSDDHSVDWTYSPIDGLDARMSYKRTDVHDNYIVVSRDTTRSDRDEVRTSQNRMLTTGARYSPKGRATSEISVDYSSSTVKDRRLVELDRATNGSSKRLEMRGKHKLLNTATFLHYENDTDNDNPVTRTSSVTYTRAVDGSLDRPWGDRFTTRISGEERLRSQVFSNGLRDLDQLKTKVEGSITYKPMPKLSAGMSGRRSYDTYNNIHPTQSRNSRREENYGLSIDVKYTITPRTRVSQTYGFNELFTSFPFNAKQDNIQRNRDISTTISSSLTKAINLDLTHQYKFRETGGYSRTGGVRYFARSDIRYEQDLKAAVSYAPISWFTFRTQEEFYRTDSIRLSDDKRTTVSRIELTQDVTFNRPLPGGGTISATANLWTQKLIQPASGRLHYVSTNITLSKPF